MTISNRYSQHARRALMQARLLARERNHAEVDTSHLVVGILRAEGSIGYRVLRDLKLDPVVALRQLDTLHKSLVHPPTANLTSQALRDTLGLAIKESASLGHHYIGTEHLLLGLARGYQGQAAALLSAAAISPDLLRRQVRRVLSTGSTEIGLERARRLARLSELSRRVLNRASQIAGERHYPQADLTHLLMALSQEKRSQMSRVLGECGLDTRQLDGLAGRRHASVTHITERVLDEAVLVAERLGSHYTGTDHILLALARDRRGAALLRHCGVDIERMIAVLEGKS